MPDPSPGRPPDRYRPFTERRGDRWRVRWPGPDGKLRSASRDDNGRPFTEEPAALQYGWEQLAKIGRGEWQDPRDGQIALTNWITRWYRGQDLEPHTLANYRSRIEIQILPAFGSWTLTQLEDAPEEIVAWERRLRAQGYSDATARAARARLATILGDAVRAGLIRANPATRPRNRGRKRDRKRSRSRGPEKKWATPLEALLIAERAAALSGRDDEFLLVVTIAWTGLRWAEILGLERGDVGSAIRVDWQLREFGSRFLKTPPKDSSYRPVDLPVFLAALLSEQPARRCTCPTEGGTSRCGGAGAYLFLGPGRAHLQRSRFGERYFRPAADGWYPEREGRRARAAMPVLVDVSARWPGAPLPPWPPAVMGERWQRPGVRRGYPTTPDDMPVACWLPVKRGLTVHGLRHGHKTWMDEDAIPGPLQSERLWGHTGPGIQGVYSHVSDDMRARLRATLQARWEHALEERREMHPRSPVAALDRLLTVPRTSTMGYAAPKSAPVVGLTSVRTAG